MGDTPAPAPGVNVPSPPPPFPVVEVDALKVDVRHHVSIMSRINASSFLPEKKSAVYEEFIKPQTAGRITPLINGRDSGGSGPDVDLVEPLAEMEKAVKSLGAGDFVYLAAWFFEPATDLVLGPLAGGSVTWGGLFAERAEAGVKIRILCNDFDPISGSDAWLQTNSLDPLLKVVKAMPEAARDNFKYTVTLHPAHVGTLKSLLAGQGGRNIHVASHHQKFMVVKKGDSLTAFCGGLDIESRKAPAGWLNGGPVWHDIHFKAEGPIAYDLEFEFVQRWNREKGKSAKNPTIKGWKPYETLAETPISSADNAAAKRIHLVQMLRTVSVDSSSAAFETKRDDIIRVYKNLVQASQEYLYLENQYFRDQTLADQIAARAKANGKLIGIFVVVRSAEDDDKDNEVTRHGNYLQNLFFRKVSAAFGKRCGIYTMVGRAVHSKLMIVDDRAILGGSANGNTRSFVLDSELNLSIRSEELAKAFRERLWAHNLGLTVAQVAAFTDPIAEWDKVAVKNEGFMATPAGIDFDSMSGEGVLKFDFNLNKGKKSLLVPDEFAYMDFNNDISPQGETALPRTANA